MYSPHDKMQDIIIHDVNEGRLVSKIQTDASSRIRFSMFFLIPKGESGGEPNNRPNPLHTSHYTTKNRLHVFTCNLKQTLMLENKSYGFQKKKNFSNQKDKT